MPHHPSMPDQPSAAHLPTARPLGPDAEGQWVRRWTSPDWDRTVDTWVGARLAERGRRISGDAVTYRARFWSVTRCYPTDEGRVWFKESNPGHRFEPGLVAAMARVSPGDVITPIAVDREHGRLLADDHGATLGHPDVADQPTRCAVVRALAQLQCTLLGRLDPADHPGLIMLAPTEVGDRMREVAAEWAMLAADHPLRIERELLARVARAADVLDRCAATLSDTVPLDLELNDVYAANIFGDRSTDTLRPRFFDFGNALWAHPFVSLHGFLDSVEEWTDAQLTGADREAVSDAYLTVWRDHLDADPRVLRDDLTATAGLVDVHRLVSWIRLIPYADPLELRTRAQIPLLFLTRVAAQGVMARSSSARTTSSTVGASRPGRPK